MIANEIRQYLQSVTAPPRFIKRGVLYDAAEVDALQLCFEESKHKSLFSKFLEPHCGLADPFYLELRCRPPTKKTYKNTFLFEHPACGRTVAVQLGNDGLMDYLRGGAYHCDSCKRKRLERCRSAVERLDQERLDETKEYIDSYCSPKKVWYEDTPQRDRWISISQRDVDWAMVSMELQRLKYAEFLKTPYWKAVAHRVKYLSGFKCQLCNGKGSLHTHHRSYEHHGLEHQHLKDLVCICQQCHQHFHDGLEVQS